MTKSDLAALVGHRVRYTKAGASRLGWYGHISGTAGDRIIVTWTSAPDISPASTVPKLGQPIVGLYRPRAFRHWENPEQHWGGYIQILPEAVERPLIY